MSNHPECRRFERWLLAALSSDGPAGPGERRAAEHRTACPDCRALEALMRQTGDAGLPKAPADLARSVMTRTTGPACESARLALSARLEGPSDRLDADLLAGHLERCRECRELEPVLADVVRVLPAMAHVSPGDGFLRQVVAATSKRKPSPPPLRHRALRWLAHAWERPRFALEVGYVGAVVIWMAIALPVSPLNGAQVPPLDQVLANARTRAIDIGHRAWAVTASEGRESIARIRGEVARERQRTEAQGAAIVSSARAFARALSAGDPDTAVRALSANSVESGTPTDPAASDQQTTNPEQTQ